MEIVNERSTSIVTLTFRDETGAQVTPSAGTYRIDDAASGTEIRASTPWERRSTVFWRSLKQPRCWPARDG